MNARISAILIVAALICGTGPAAADSTPAMFRCNPAHTGVCATAPLRDDLRPRWRFFTGNLNRSTPLYWQRTVYVGSNNGRFYALDAATGRERGRSASAAR